MFRPCDWIALQVPSVQLQEVEARIYATSAFDIPVCHIRHRLILTGFCNALAVRFLKHSWQARTEVFFQWQMYERHRVLQLIFLQYW